MGEYQPIHKYDVTQEAVKNAQNQLKGLESSISEMRFMMGFDGYVDLLYNMVKNRENINEVEIYSKMENFGKKIVDTSGSSTSIERVLKKKIGGGFAPNMARAIANMGPSSTVNLYAALGYPDPLDIFKKLPENVNLHSIGTPGETLAMEFSDGKIMSQDMGGIFEITWKNLVNRVGGLENLISAFNQSDAIGNGHWSLMLTMNSIFEHFIEEVLPKVKNPENKLFFVDPADLGKRSKKDIKEMLSLLGKIDEFIPVVLSLNDREAIDIAEVLSDQGCQPIDRKKDNAYFNAGININQILDLSYLVIHEPHFATITGSSNDNSFHYWVTEGYTSNPKYTVAAGDHFNAGILMSLIGDLSPKEALVVANAATAIFVRTGISPSIQNLEDFIQEYFEFIFEDIEEFKMK